MLALLVAAVLSAAAAAFPVRPVQPAWAGQVDRVFSQWQNRSSPGCAVGVYENGRIAYEAGYGSADLEHDVPIAPDSVFYVGSLSKQFTAFAAALAVEQGRLSPDDSIRKFLPELPRYADAITVRHLIHHTSGLRDYNTLLSIAGRRGDDAYDNPAVLRITARQQGLNFQPGAEYLYSNTGYTLLAIIVARATGTPFAEFAEARIFKPLAMDVTHYHVDAGRLIKGRAFAYAPASGGTWTLDTPSNERAGAGGVYTNVRDLLRWDENFYEPRVGGKALVRQVQTPGRLNDGSTLSYAWGLQVGTYRGKPIVEHGGSLGGYRAHLLRFPEQHTSVAILCNLGSIVPGGLARDVADAVMGTAFTQPRAPTNAAAAVGNERVRVNSPPASSDGPGSLAGYVGIYHSDEIDATFTVTLKGSGLLVQRESDAEPVALQSSGDETYRLRGMTIRFERGSDGAVAALTVDAGRVRDIRFARRDGKQPAR